MTAVVSTVSTDNAKIIGLLPQILPSVKKVDIILDIEDCYLLHGTSLRLPIQEMDFTKIQHTKRSWFSQI